MADKTIWGDFEVYTDQPLGQGGMGAVYRGKQISVDRPVAVKVLKRDLTGSADFVARFQREAKLVARIVDSHVVQVFGAGEADGSHYYVMEFVEGEDLAKKIRSGRQFTAAEIAEVALRVGKALSAAWRFKIVHRDIKPSNIVITKDGLIKVMDFGLAKNPDMDLTRSELIMGTVKYMSPEQATGGDVDVRSDMYSLGCVLYELAVGAAPFKGDSATAVLYQHVHQRPAPPKQLRPDIPEGLQALIMRCLAKSPQERFQTPEELSAAARSLIGGQSSTSVTIERQTVDGPTTLLPDSKVQPTAPKTGLYAGLGVAAAVLVTVAVILIVAMSGGGTPAPPGPGPGPRPDPLAKGPDAKDPETKQPDAKQPDVKDPETKQPDVKDPETKQPDAKQPDPAAAPEWEKKYVESRAEADRFFADGKWGPAYDAYLRAPTGLPDDDAKTAERRADCAAKAQSCLFFQAREKGEALAREGKLPQAILAFEEARRHLAESDPRRAEIDQQIRSFIYQVRIGAAREKMGAKNWADAADDFARAREVAPDNEARMCEENEQFCRKFAEANAAFGRGTDWPKVKAMFEELLANPHGFQDDILGKLQTIRKEIADLDRKAAEEKRRQFDERVARGKALFAKAQWADALQVLEDAGLMGLTTPEFESLVRHARVAAKPPEGFVYVPAGKFTLGTGDESSPAGPEQPVETGAYLIGKREVTVREYRKFLEAGADHSLCFLKEPAEKKSKGHAPDGWSDRLDADAAVTGLDWYDAYAYAAWAGARLPSEVEWEKAAGTSPASGKRTVYPWGEEYQKGTGGASPCGAEGMGSGALEWTNDWYKPYAGGKAKELDFGEKRRVARGGVRSDGPEEAKVTKRFRFLPDRRDPSVGFRIAKTIE